jgi:hypothetical protein
VNSDETWQLYLWSGAFASAVGGAVAMLVLWRTNAHQSKLAAEQLNVQKSEAKRNRCTAVVGDLVAAIEQLPSAAESSVDEVNSRIFAATSALTRLSLEDMDESTVAITRKVVGDLWKMALKVVHPPVGYLYDDAIHENVLRTHTLVRKISERFVDLAPILLREVMGESKPDDAARINAIIRDFDKEEDNQAATGLS